MSEELKYPIRYAIMPIIEETNNEIIFYMVSKCYVISEKKEYLKDGKCKITYEIVFPYFEKMNFPNYIENLDYFYEVNLDLFKNMKRIFPEYNIYKQCSNSTIISQLFSSLDDALYVANKMNEEKNSNKRGCIRLDEYYDRNCEKLEKKFSVCKEIEQIIANHTADMLILSEVEVKQRILKNK